MPVDISLADSCMPGRTQMFQDTRDTKRILVGTLGLVYVHGLIRCLLSRSTKQTIPLSLCFFCTCAAQSLFIPIKTHHLHLLQVLRHNPYTGGTMTVTNHSPPIANEEKLDVDKKEPLHPTNSVVEGQSQQLQEDRNGQFHRSFSPRQVHVSSFLPSQ